MQAFQKMKELGIRCLVATDLAGRGLDLPDVRVVVELDPASSHREEEHRAGRACRYWGNKGLVI